jgi:hypothetical protein
MNASNYAHPDPEVRVIESNEDVSLYDTGHIPASRLALEIISE